MLMKNLPVLCALLSVLPLWACVDAPATAPRTAQIAAASLGLDAATAPIVPKAWWTGFHDPQADRLIGRMMQDNPTLQGALARIRSAEAQLSVSRTDQYPQIALDASVQRSLLTNASVIPRPYAGTYQWLGDVQAKMTWSLDFWGRQAALIDKARHTADALALDADAARLALAGAFTQTYVGLLLAWQNVEIADQTVDERQAILTLTQSRFQSGLENGAALEQARALLALARGEALRARAARDTGVHALAALTGQGPAGYDAIVRPAASLETLPPLPTAIPADLLSRRPDILAAQARIRAAVRGRDAAHADFYPNINLTAAIGFQAIGLSGLFGDNALTLGAGPALHLPLFDAGKIRAQYARATADLDEAVADYNAAVLDAVRQTADALTGLNSLGGQQAEQQMALDSAQRAFRLAEERYRLGLSDQIPMLTAQSTLLQARQQMAALAAQTVTQRVSLLLAVGGGFTPSTDGPSRQEDAHD